MELGRGGIVVGVLIAVGMGAGIAWWHQPRPDDSARAIEFSTAPGAATPAPAEKPPALYKWMDDNGVWTYTDQPPADREFEVIRGTPRVTNVPTVVPEVPSTPGSGDMPPPAE